MVFPPPEYPGGYKFDNPGLPRCGWVPCVSTWVTETAYAVLFFMALTFVFVVPFISHQVSRFGWFRGWPAVVSAAMVLYGCALVAFTLFPLPDFAGDYCEAHADVNHWQLIPLQSFIDLTEYAASNGLLATLTSNVLLQVVMNVAFFVPLGFFLAYRGRRSLGATALIGLVISLAIELTQGTGLWGLAPCPYRLADVDDLLTNTTGALLGWLIGRAGIRLLPDPTPVKRSDVDPPGPTRQTVGFFLDIYTYLLFDVVIIITLGLLGFDLLEQPGWPIVLPATVSLVMFVLIPRLRRDRAGPGIAGVHLAVVHDNKASTPAALTALVVRWLIVWLPAAVVGVWWLAACLAVDGLTTWRSSDHRPLTLRLTRTRQVTLESLPGANRSETREPTP